MNISFNNETIYNLISDIFNFIKNDYKTIPDEYETISALIQKNKGILYEGLDKDIIRRFKYKFEDYPKSKHGKKLSYISSVSLSIMFIYSNKYSKYKCYYTI